MINPASVCVVVFSGFAGDDCFGVVPETVGARNADVDGFPILHHVQYRPITGCRVLRSGLRAAVVVWTDPRVCTTRIQVVRAAPDHVWIR